uniref:Uncharacterized protein n=1 Tax=Ananas comosus var. bracteatus TaxID=296719 RepID=A0A6V7NWJ8_ANACO|nr:unnamed protein product [Ananas comosus var. bracteatus]
MAGSGRAELASNNPDGSAFTYPNGQRGVYSGSNLDRSGSFREGSESRVQVSGAGTSRNSASAVEIPPVSQYLSLEPLSTGEQKYPRSVELRRVLGVIVEEHSFGPVQSKPLPLIAFEDVKRFKTSIEGSSTRAKERIKFLHESMQKLDKYRNLVSRKRQKSDLSAEKFGSSNLLKMGTQTSQNPTESLSLRLEDRAKNPEGRGPVSIRQSTVVDKEKVLLFDKDNKTMLRTCNGGPVVSEDKLRVLSPGGEVLDKKMRRKRSVGTMVNRSSDADREVKQAVQHRSNNDIRPRSSDNLSFRPGSSSGVIGSTKMDGSSQQSGTASRVMPKNDVDNGPASNERRERATGLDKERLLAKGNKQNICEDAQVGSQSPLTKGKASRAPRTGPTIIGNSSSTFPRSFGGIDSWDQSVPAPNKIQPLPGMPHHKRPVSSGPSSPPVTQWVRQRQHKISRQRRANIVPPLPNFDEAPTTFSEGFVPPDVGTRSASMEPSGHLPTRGIAGSSQQLKLKTDSVSSPLGLSESEESVAVENKFKDKVIVDHGDIEEGPASVLKVTTSIVPTKKSKVNLKEEIGDGVRRQGRSGRGSMQSKACLPLSKEKLETVDNTKPLKSGRLGSDKIESRVGRPPSKKASDRKAGARPAQTIQSGSSDLTGESDDDREELLAAANAARKASSDACSSSFWRTMEPIFTRVTSKDTDFVMTQMEFVEELDRSMFDVLDADHRVMDDHPFQSSPRSSGQNKMNASGKVGKDQWLEKIVPLSQRLLSALITEDENELFDCNSEEDDGFEQFSSDYSPYASNSHVGNEHGAHDMKSDFGLDFRNPNSHSMGNVLPNVFTTSSNFRSSNIHTLGTGDDLLQAQSNVSVPSENGPLSEYGPTISTQLNTSPQNSLFEHMSLNDRILLELQSIGLHQETAPELDQGELGEIDKVISELKMRLCQQVKQNKNQLLKLEKALQEAKVVDDRTLEQLAMNKLVEAAYRKLLGGRGSSSHKAGMSKVSKQLALAFAKRTVARCHKFEEMGRSCFSEPPFRDLILNPPTTDPKYFEAATELLGVGQKLDGALVDQHQGLTHNPEQTSIKNDPTSNKGEEERSPSRRCCYGFGFTCCINHHKHSFKWSKMEKIRSKQRFKKLHCKSRPPVFKQRKGRA